MQVCRSLRLSGTTVPRTYEAAFQRAIWTFHHQRVYDPAAKTMVHLRPLPQTGLDPACLPEEPGSQGSPSLDVLSFLGPLLPDHVCCHVAAGACCFVGSLVHACARGQPQAMPCRRLMNGCGSTSWSTAE